MVCRQALENLSFLQIFFVAARSSQPNLSLSLKYAMSETPRKRRRAAFQGNYASLDDAVPVQASDSEFEAHESEDEVTKSPPQTPSRRAARPARTPGRTPGRTPRKPGDLDKSARKRATKLLLKRADDGLDDEEEELAERIIAESREVVPSTPSKSPLKSPSKGPYQSPVKPVLEALNQDQGSQTLFLDGYEGYFEQHKSREKISTTPFSRAPELNYQQFVNYVQQSKSIHSEERSLLKSIYQKMYTQWYFELTQGYSVMFYGLGSKRNMILDFVSTTLPEEIPIFVVNGYNPATTFKEILLAVVSTLVPEETRKQFPKNPPDLLAALIKYLEAEQPTLVESMVVVIHNIDGESLRHDRDQALLARLVSASKVWLVASIDHIEAPVLWDAAKMSQYNFVWHDLTTYELYTVETSFEDPLSLGKNRSAVGTKGVKYVLASLTANARSLYKLLAFHQLEVMTEELGEDNNVTGSAQHGIEFKRLYQQCVEQFIVSNELNFRTMLTEFLEHKMAATTKDATGVEIIYIPFTQGQLENTVEELTEM